MVESNPCGMERLQPSGYVNLFSRYEGVLPKYNYEIKLVITLILKNIGMDQEGEGNIIWKVI